jgi:hypothetical protein
LFVISSSNSNLYFRIKDLGKKGESDNNLFIIFALHDNIEQFIYHMNAFMKAKSCRSKSEEDQNVSDYSIEEEESEIINKLLRERDNMSRMFVSLSNLNLKRCEEFYNKIKRNEDSSTRVLDMFQTLVLRNVTLILKHLPTNQNNSFVK